LPHTRFGTMGHAPYTSTPQFQLSMIVRGYLQAAGSDKGGSNNCSRVCKTDSYDDRIFVPGHVLHILHSD
jgi:hypothetical protein